MQFTFSRFKKGYVAPAVLVAGAVLLTILSSSRQLPADEIPVKASKAVAAPSRIVGPGRVEPSTGEIDLAAELPGIVSKVYVKEGDEVKKGQVVADLVQNDLIARIDEAEANFKLKSIIYKKLKNGARPEEKQQAAARVKELEQSYSLLEKRLKRQKTVFKDGFLTPDAMDEASSSLAEADARKQQAVHALDLLKAGTRTEDIEAAKTEVELAKAQLDTAKASLEKARVRATVDGTVLRIYRKTGEAASIQPPAPVMQIGDLRLLIVRAQIDESDIGGLKSGLRAEVRASAFPGETFGGVVSEISPRVGGKTIRTNEPTEKVDTNVIDVKIALDPGISLPIGMRVDAYILAGDKAKPVEGQ